MKKTAHRSFSTIIIALSIGHKAYNKVTKHTFSSHCSKLHKNICKSLAILRIAYCVPLAYNKDTTQGNTPNEKELKEMRKSEIIERGEGYKIYKKDNMYFVTFYYGRKKQFDEGFDTLQGAIEHTYYQGLRETK